MKQLAGPSPAAMLRAKLIDAEQVALIRRYLQDRAKVDAPPEVNEIVAPAPTVVAESTCPRP